MTPRGLLLLVSVVALALSSLPANIAHGRDTLTVEVAAGQRMHAGRQLESALSDAHRFRLQVQQLQKQVESARVRLQESEREEGVLPAQIAALEHERDGALWELRNGYFCSKCDRSRTEIEATGEEFNHHLGRVRGQRVPARPELIASKEQKYEQRIEALRQQLEHVRRQVEEQRRQLSAVESALHSAQFSYNQAQGGIAGLYSAWRMAVTHEFQAREERFERSRLRAMQMLREHQQIARELMGRVSPDERREVWSAYERARDEYRAAQWRFRGEQQEREQRLRAAAEKHQRSAAQLGVNVLLPYWPLSPTVLSGNWSIGSSSGSVEVSDQHVGFGVDLGRVFAINMSAQIDPLLVRNEVRSTLEGFGVGVGLSMVTEFGPNGVTMRSVPVLTVAGENILPGERAQDPGPIPLDTANDPRIP